MSDHFHLFVYGTLRSNGTAASVMSDSELVGAGSVGGVLYDIDGAYPALVLYGNTPVRGEVWRCPSRKLLQLDAYESVAEGLFRRVGVQVELDNGSVQGCWAYVAGPRLSQKLIPGRRVASWRAEAHRERN
jgi:gamma-glutamylcyclotransferase (GGCT)/AIG2-like uncharacterized protein YtfP